MAANTQPIFPKVPKVQSGTVLTANTAKDGTGTVVSVFTAGLDGSRVDTIKVRSLGTNVATVLRIFINNGLVNTTAANNSLYMERTIAATTVSETAELVDVEILLNISLPPSYVLNITIGTTIAAGLQVTAVGGDY